MRVHVELSHYFDQVPVPSDVEVTQKDLDSGRVKVSRSGGHMMRVTREAHIAPKHEAAIVIGEGDIINKLVAISLPPPRGRSQKVPRKEAVASLIAEHVMQDICAPKHIRAFTVEDDGPDEKLFRAMVEPLTQAEDERGGTGAMIVPPEDFDALLAGYMATAPPEHHVDHLHAKFAVKRAS
jgi:hypothetical protein